MVNNIIAMGKKLHKKYSIFLFKISKATNDHFFKKLFKYQVKIEFF